MLTESTRVDFAASSPKNRFGNPAIKPPVSKTEYLNLGSRFRRQRSVLNLQIQVQTIPTHTSKFVTATTSFIVVPLFQGEIFV